jgi:hypothetical protein
MAVTINLQAVITWVQTILRQQPLNVTNMEPGLTFANLVLQRVLGPPMRWRFNRGNVSWAISQAGATDYAISIPDLLWPEVYWLVNAAGTVQPCEGRVVLPKSATVDRPTEISPVYDDNAGTITMRCNTIPDANYTAFMDYQRKAKLLTSYGSTFGPVPDEFSYIFQKLYLAIAAQLVGDPRAAAWSAEGVAALLGAQNGLTVQEIAIFLAEWDRLLNSLANSTGMQKFGIAGLAR